MYSWRLDKLVNQPWHMFIPTAALAIVLSLSEHPYKDIQDNPNAKHEQTYNNLIPDALPISNSHFTVPANYASASPMKSSKLPHTVNFVLK
jgi:hypothetical protein